MVVDVVLVVVVGMPKRAARRSRFSSSVVRVVEGRWEVKVCGGGGGGSLEGAETVRSEVCDGSIAGVWLGTEVGVGTAPSPPAARAVAAVGVDAGALTDGFAGALRGVGSATVGADVMMVVPSSSQSISSSGARGAVGFLLLLLLLLLVVDFEADEDVLSSCWRRATSSAFLPVWGRDRAFSSSSSSAFFFLP